jgi:hypothetical protein
MHRLRILMESGIVMAAALLVLALANRSTAALQAYEGFDYSPDGSDLVGASGGSGFSGGWAAGGFNASISNNFDRENDALSFGALQTSGGAVRTGAVGAIAGVTRNLAAPLGQANTTAYVSFLVRPEGTLNAGAFNGFLGLVLESAGEPELFIGKPGGGAINNWVVEDRGGTGQHSSSTAASTTATTLLVVKAVFAGAGNDTISLYVNPTPGAPEPTAGVLKNDANFGAITGLTIYSSGAMRIDELRVGETFADVTPIPEPGGLELIVASALALPLLCRVRFVRGEAFTLAS